MCVFVLCVCVCGVVRMSLQLRLRVFVCVFCVVYVHMNACLCVYMSLRFVRCSLFSLRLRCMVLTGRKYDSCMDQRRPKDVPDKMVSVNSVQPFRFENPCDCPVFFLCGGAQVSVCLSVCVFSCCARCGNLTTKVF